MADVKITLPDGKSSSCPAGTPVGEALARLGLTRSLTVAAKVDGVAVDLTHLLRRDSAVEAIDASSSEGLTILRHSAAHVMAQAVQEVFPTAQVTIGPAIEDGFYYDFDYEPGFSPADLATIESRMREIIKADYPFERREMSRREAIDLFRKKGENYKIELINDLPEEVQTVSIYSQNGYTDLCRGPHIPSTGIIKAFKLLSIAGAYWRGDEHNKMLQRIYGTAFDSKEKLDEYLRLLEEAKKRDHRRLGRELDLFQINEEAGPGLVIFHPRGTMLRTIIEDWERKEHLKRGYGLVIGPQILKADLWKRSGHFDHYRENMYFTEVDEQLYGIKPMNCLSHMLIYKAQTRSYRDLPIRYFELGTVHRHEKAGVLHGLMRVRQFTQDDAHIICAPEQLNSEIKGVAEFVRYAMGIFGFEYDVELSTRPENSIGSDEDWQLATRALEDALRDSGIPYEVNEGDGAFYGPKIDFKIKDALKRRWQCATIQCDFTLPERFDLTYIGEDGQKHRAVMLHRVILGAIERFMGVLIEHYAGAFPLWLSPVQALIVTVTEKHIPWGRDVERRLFAAGIRVEADFRNEKLGYKIREAQVQKIPFMLVIGDREMEAHTISPRMRDGKSLEPMNPDGFIELVRNQCAQFK